MLVVNQQGSNYGSGKFVCVLFNSNSVTYIVPPGKTLQAKFIGTGSMQVNGTSLGVVAQGPVELRLPGGTVLSGNNSSAITVIGYEI